MNNYSAQFILELHAMSIHIAIFMSLHVACIQVASASPIHVLPVQCVPNTHTHTHTHTCLVPARHRRRLAGKNEL